MKIPSDYGYVSRGTCFLPIKAISKSNEKRWNHSLSDKFRVFENTVSILTRSAWGTKSYDKGWIIIQCYFKTKKHCDLNNLPKSIFDGIKKGRTIKDDKDFAVTVLPVIYGNVDKIEMELWT